MPRSERGRFWCFTINNPTATDVPQPNATIGYMIYQKEEGKEEHTPHYQGYMECKKPVTTHAISKWPGFTRARLSLRIRDASYNITYCSKEPRLEPTVIFGTPSRIGVTRTYTEMVEAIHTGATAESLIDDHLEEYIKHKHSVDAVIRAKRQLSKSDIVLPPIVLSEWQAGILTLLASEPDPRKVHWFYDTLGGKGKSTFTKYLIRNYGAIMIDTTKKDRVIRAYDNERVVVFDITRQEGQEGTINYSIMETMKNGFGFNTMYDPGLKVWHVPHVIVFSNFVPDCSKLSADRWDITQL